MVRPISLKPHWPSVLREARSTLRRLNEQDRLRRRTKFAAFRAIHAAREAFDYAEKLEFRFMTEIDQKRWREQRKLVEAELSKLARS
jgi:hypothetical protein